MIPVTFKRKVKNRDIFRYFKVQIIHIFVQTYNIDLIPQFGET